MIPAPDENCDAEPAIVCAPSYAYVLHSTGRTTQIPTFQTIPAWFAADQTFNAPDGWYIGSPEGFSVGPYRDRDHAEGYSRTLATELNQCSNASEVAATVRRFIHEQTIEPGRWLRSGVARAATTDSPDAPPRRSGEKPRVRFRTNRFFSAGGQWYFATRETLDVGPYATRADAERDAGRLLDILRITRTLPERRLVTRLFAGRLLNGEHR